MQQTDLPVLPLAMAMATALCLPVAGLAGVVKEKEANDTLASAQAVDGRFTLDFSPDIGNGTHVDNTSLTIPHVTVHGSGDGSFDYFSFCFPGAGGTSGFVVLDIDHAYASGFDSRVALWSASGDLLGHNDDYDHRGGAGGSVPRPYSSDSNDALMTTYLAAPGTYIVGVARSLSSPVKDGFEDGFALAKPQPGDFYTLQISVENMPVVPEPGSFGLLGLGLLALVLAALPRARAAPNRR